MRTTFTPAPDLVDRLRELVSREDRSMNAVLNDLVRIGLSGQVSVERRQRYRLKPKPLGLRQGIDPLKLKELLAEIEVGSD